MAARITDIFKDVRNTREKLEEIEENIAFTKMEIRAQKNCLFKTTFKISTSWISAF